MKMATPRTPFWRAKRRTIAREALGFVPGLGWAIKGGVAYAGTKALGKAATAYFEQGGAHALSRAADAVRSRS